MRRNVIGVTSSATLFGETVVSVEIRFLFWGNYKSDTAVYTEYFIRGEAGEKFCDLNAENKTPVNRNWEWRARYARLR